MLPGTVVRIADNSGARLLRIIKILGKKPKSRGLIGDSVIGSVIHTNPKKPHVKTGIIVHATIIRSAISKRRYDDERLRFQYSAVVITNRKNIPKANKIYGPCARELRLKGYIRIVSLASIAL